VSDDLILDTYACGWRLRAGLPLPATIAWPRLAPGRPDVAFIAGSVAGELPLPVVDVGTVQIAADGAALVRFEAGYFLINRNRVTCDLGVMPESPELAPVVFGNILACLGLQHGKLPLHAAAVAIDGRAILLLGRAGAGKSALAAALARAGMSVLADEAALVSEACCLPAGGPLHLADDMLTAAGVDPAGLPQCGLFSKLPKRQWQGGSTPDPEPYPIAAVVCLGERVTGTGSQPSRLAPSEAADAILNHLFWRDMLRLPAFAPGLRREAASLASAAPVYTLSLPRTAGPLEEAAALIGDLVSAAAGFPAEDIGRVCEVTARRPWSTAP
jgi:hypothetical protein